MKSLTTIAVLMCLALCTSTLASAVDDQPMLDEEPGVMRRLQGVFMDGHDANKFFKKADKAADAVKDAISTKVENVHNVASKFGEKAAKEMKQAVKADAKMFDSIGEAAAKSFKSSGEAIAATGKAIGAGAANLATAPFGIFRKEAHKASKEAHEEAKEAFEKAAKGVKKVKRAVAKAADKKADALEDTAEAAAHAMKRAVIKDSIAKKVAAMKVHKAVGAGVKAVLKP